MDYFGYKQTPQNAGKTPAQRIVAKRMRWDVSTGLHPHDVDGSSAVWDIDPLMDGGKPKVSPEWQMDPRGVIDGHNVMTDANLMRLLEVDQEVPISPLFVRDLAGRAVYIGPGPERKDVGEWESYGATQTNEDGGLKNPLVPLVVFPRKCWPADAVRGHDLLERVFFLKFRTLDMGRDYVEIPSGAEGVDDLAMRAEYRLANMYPYKYRLDTFYVDGWKLPQTQMLFAKWQGIRASDAKQVGEDMLKAWGSRGEDKDYEAWVEEQGGEKWMGSLFEKGCTLIPTFDAYNGYNVVNSSFELEDVWPGRAVGGLHEIVEARADKAPANTILRVVQPGYVTATAIVPAKVVVSDGSKYVSPNMTDPAPLVPNLHLPHQRTLDNWEATWVPTHPAHFEAPALWGWDFGTGRFLQINGPLWDPLHYHYACMEAIRKAIKTPMEQNRWLTAVPDDMQGRFYPVVPMRGFDVVAFEALERRAARASLPISAVTHVPSSRESCGIGYHPLPIEFEYEMDPYWFPDLHPLNRMQGICPDEMMDRVCPVITPTVSPEAYADAIKADDEYPWLADKSMLATPGQQPLDNYPLLARYLLPEIDAEILDELMPLPFLAEMGNERLSRTPQEFWKGVDSLDDLEELASGLHEAVWALRETGLEGVRTRHLIYRTAPRIYRLGWWMGSSPANLQLMYAGWLQQQENPDMLRQSIQPGPAKPAMPMVAAPVEGE